MMFSASYNSLFVAYFLGGHPHLVLPPFKSTGVFYFGGFKLSEILMPPTDNLIDRFGFDSKAETPNKLIRVYIQPGIAGTKKLGLAPLRAVKPY